MTVFALILLVFVWFPLAFYGAITLAGKIAEHLDNAHLPIHNDLDPEDPS